MSSEEKYFSDFSQTWPKGDGVRLPGDLVFASGYNNVVITGKEGFVSVGRPRYFAE